MTVHVVDLKHCPAQPWRNGGGLTRELLTWPQADGWQLRVSVARIARSGPFSPFPGVQRCFAVLHGQGVRLDLPGGARAVTAADSPLSFDGEAAPMCHLLDGPTDDLNLMVHRDAGHAVMHRATPGSDIDGPTRWRALFAVAPARLDVGDRSQVLAAGTLAWSDDADGSAWRLHDGGPALWMWLEA